MTNDQTALVSTLKTVLENNTAKVLPNIAPRVAAAVLVPFCHFEGQWHLLFTKRTTEVAKHRGEISFPGGAAEASDRDLIETAVREACEEIGVCDGSIEIIGVMEPVPTVSNYCILPVVGIVQWPRELKLNPSEVEQIILIPVSWLREDTHWYIEEFHFASGESKPVIHYEDFQGEHLWGITASLAQKITAKL
jgi:8-oxo-dGTP pyrophosphatase MutT (NUDIX family)